MELNAENNCRRDAIKEKLRQNFDGKIVRKDLTKKIKEGANVPVYVLEFLLGQYCSSDDEEIIEQGVQNVKHILADNFVRPDEAQKILSQLRKKGSHTVIDMITVNLDIKKNCFFASFSNLGLDKVPIADEYPEKYDRLLCGGIWCIVQLDYEVEGDNNFGLVDLGGEPLQSSQKKQKDLTPISIRKLTPIQMPHIDIEEVRAGRKAFTQDEWLDILLRSIGMEPDEFTEREKWLLLTRMIPLVENNFNLCELGPRSTGKSHLYKEISPNSILISGGQTTVANLFYNMGRKTVGLVGLWDCVAFDEVAGIKFKDKDGIQIMKDYMASGSFARGKEEKAASASMVFVGNINQSVDVLLKTSSLFDPFPPEMGTDTAFLDRLHCYIPGWEIPKFRPEHFTNDYGFITDYLAEFIRELRKEQYGDALDKYFRLGKNLNQRDTIAVRKIVGGYVKLLYPDGEFTKEQLEEILVFALEMRRRVKEQLKKLGGMEFYDVNFSYIDLDTFEEKFVSVPEQGGGKLIPDGMCNPGQIYTVSRGKSGMIGVFRLESQMLPGSGKFERTGLGSDRDCRESTNTAFNFLKANGKRISGGISTASKDYIINYQDLQGIGMTGKLALPTLIALCSIALGRPTVSTLAVLGEISISGTILKVDELANSLQVCLDSGAKKVLLPITSAADLGTVPPELVGSFNLIFYSSAEDIIEDNCVYNLTAVILPYEEKWTGQWHSVILYHSKNHFAPEEKRMIESLHLRAMEGIESSEAECDAKYELYSWNGFWFTVYCCFELTSIRDRSIFQSYIDALIAVEWNQDVNYYSNIIESLSRDIHCYCIQTNTSKYGDSRITKPSKTENKDILRIKGGSNATAHVGTIDLEQLREFQMKAYSGQKEDKTFKPTPPDFDYKGAYERRKGTMFECFCAKKKAD